MIKMATHVLSLPRILAMPSLPQSHTRVPFVPRCSSTRPSSGRRRWDSYQTRKVDFDPKDDEDEDEQFGFYGKQRTWWLDDDDDDDDEEEDEFWVFKVLRAFGWMFPAVAISLLLGTGPNAFLMALVPLGQTALSMIFDKLWGGASGGTKPKRSKTRKKPFARSAYGFRTNKKRQEDFGTDKGGNYSSWASGSSSAKRDNQRKPRFGGWDELDRGECTDKSNTSTSRNKGDIPSEPQTKSKLSRRVRRRDTPLFLRLLIAVFPFLGSWTRLLF